MITIHEVYDDRKAEIEFYFSVMLEVNDESKNTINTIDNQRFFRIMKSNFLLMLYNLVEATFTTGMMELYEQVATEGCSYSSVIDELQEIWRNSKVKEIYKASSGLTTYTNRVKAIVDDITQNTPMILGKWMLGVNGNLNARLIKKICDNHRIRYQVTDDKYALEKVKQKRNSLAHGDESFSRCSRDITLNDLEIIKDSVLLFMEEIIQGIEKYCNEKQYMRSSQRTS